MERADRMAFLMKPPQSSNLSDSASCSMQVSVCESLKERFVQVCEYVRSRRERERERERKFFKAAENI